MEQNSLAKFDEYVPKMKMRVFVECLLSPEVMGNKYEAARRTGVSQQLFFYHLRYAKDKEQFTAWYTDQCRKFIISFRDRISSALIEKATSGDVPAIRLCFELMGDIKAGGLNIQANALPGSRQPLVVVLDKALVQEPAVIDVQPEKEQAPGT